MGILQNFQKFRTRVRKSYRTSRSSGYCGTGVQNSQKFRAGTKHAVPIPQVLWTRAYRTPRSSGYGYECPTELAELLGRVIPGVNTPGMVYRRTELPEVPGIGMNVLRTELTGVLCSVPRVWFVRALQNTTLAMIVEVVLIIIMRS